MEELKNQKIKGRERKKEKETLDREKEVPFTLPTTVHVIIVRWEFYILVLSSIEHICSTHLDFSDISFSLCVL